MARMSDWAPDIKLNAAAQEVLALIFTTPSRQSESPLQPANEESGEGVAVRVTTVPKTYDLKQSEPQLIPPISLVTVPVPVPVLLTVRE